jgi:YfiR/HmsC-like
VGILTALVASSRARGRVACSRALALVALWLASGVVVPAQRTTFDEREVKAVFLFNFAQFVEWPTSAFANPDTPVLIGVLGDDPFGAVLDEAVRGEVVRGRQLMVARFRRVEDVKNCHVLFISPSESASYSRIIAALRGQPTLTVGETAGFTTSGMVRFVTEGNRVRLEVNVSAVKAAGLTVSSNLLRAARIVGTRG